MNIKYSLDEVDDAAKKILNHCKYKSILFYGDMGAGKTTLIQAIVRNLGSLDKVSSPTFSIVNEYIDQNQNPIYHFDFYRINNENELNQLGLEEYFSEDHWLLIEWPEKINNNLPFPTHIANIDPTNNDKRVLTVS